VRQDKHFSCVFRIRAPTDTSHDAIEKKREIEKAQLVARDNNTSEKHDKIDITITSGQCNR
jgi:hypothetical protein